MARIRLRNCYIRLIDGFTKAGTVEEAVPANAATDLDITIASGLIPVSSRFHIVGANRMYTVTQATGSPKTTNVRFTPALATADGIPAHDAAIAFTGRQITIKVNTGTFTWERQRPVGYDLDRGRLSGAYLEDDVPVSVNFDVEYDFITGVTGSAVPMPEDVLKQRGEAADWVSAASDPCETYAINIELEHIPPCSGIDREIVPFPDFRYESINHDVKGGRLAIAGKCKVTTITPIRRAY